jgi:hypothetical protein
VIADFWDLEQWFYSVEVWGYLGPLALVIVGYLLTKSNKNLGIAWFVFLALVTTQYLGLMAAEPRYLWHVLFLIGGGFLGCVLPQLDR